MKLQIDRLNGANVLKRGINGVLQLFGLQLVRLGKRNKIQFPPSPEESREVDRILTDFTNQYSDSVDDLRKWKGYLTDTRISFFHEILQLIADHEICLRGLRVADFGSGTGYLLRLIASTEPSALLTGFDTFSDVNELAKMFCPGADFHDSWPQAGSERFDLIFCTEVLEHLISPGDQLCQLVEALAPGGRLVLSVPNGRTDSQPAFNRREDGTGYWGHIHFWSPESWPLFLAEALPKDASINTGLLPSGENFGLVKLSGDQRDGANRIR